jgi:hypothetical protein
LKGLKRLEKVKENKKTKSGGRKNKKEMLRGFFTFRRILSAYGAFFFD